MTTAVITSETTTSGLTIFYAGAFTDAQSATAAKQEIVSGGIKDAFIAAFSDGKKNPVSSIGSSAKK